MSLTIAEGIVTMFAIYAIAGVVFALAFLPRAVARLDTGVAGAPKLLRLLLLPGVVALWPLCARRWLTGGPTPIERNAHREAALASRPPARPAGGATA